MTELEKRETFLSLIVNYLRNAQYDLYPDDEGGIMVMVRGSRNKNSGLDVLLERNGAGYTPREVTIYTPNATFREERTLNVKKER